MVSELVWGTEPTPEFAAWRLVDSDIAESEHWNVFDSAGSENGPWQIQKVDEVHYWDDDTDVWLHVVRRAYAGSETHLRALRYVAAHNPPEFEAITKHIREGEWT
jgi:hypothetical protein